MLNLMFLRLTQPPPKQSLILMITSAPPPFPPPAGYIKISYDLMILTHHPSKNHKIRSKATLFTDDTHLLYIVTLLSVGSQAETIIWLHGTQNKIRTKQR